MLEEERKKNEERDRQLAEERQKYADLVAQMEAMQASKANKNYKNFKANEKSLRYPDLDPVPPEQKPTSRLVNQVMSQNQPE